MATQLERAIHAHQDRLRGRALLGAVRQAVLADDHSRLFLRMITAGRIMRSARLLSNGTSGLS
ncbi:MAG: hypothetical protein L6Q93_05850, partial [Phycisphaerae bacterium]|nr:hypothetical protein [Phycisphaerae bacterium]